MPLAAFPKCFLHQLCVTREMSVYDWIGAAADLGVDGLEFYWHFTPRDPDEVARVRRYAEDRKLEIPMMCHSPDFTHPSARGREAAFAEQLEAMRVTAALGGKYCRVLSGQAHPQTSLADGIRWATDSITRLLPEAERLGVVLILENHFKDGYWDHPEFAQPPEVFFEILDGIPDSPNFGVNYDPSNALVAGADPVEFLRRVAPRVVTMHASDRRLRSDAQIDPASGTYSYSDLEHGVIGTGVIPYEEVFQVLRDHDFQGWISIENGDDPTHGLSHLAESATFLRGLMQRYRIA